MRTFISSMIATLVVIAIIMVVVGVICWIGQYCNEGPDKHEVDKYLNELDKCKSLSEVEAKKKEFKSELDQKAYRQYFHSGWDRFWKNLGISIEPERTYQEIERYVPMQFKER